MFQHLEVVKMQAAYTAAFIPFSVGNRDPPALPPQGGHVQPMCVAPALLLPKRGGGPQLWTIL